MQRNGLGFNARYDLISDTCECNYGYLYSESKKKCISEDEYCTDLIGDNSSYFLDHCECDIGYLIPPDDKECISEEDFCEDTLGDNSEYIGNFECECSRGYVLYNDICISEEEYCGNYFGENTEYVGGSECKCISGYTLGSNVCEFQVISLLTNDKNISGLLLVIALPVFLLFLIKIFRRNNN